MQAVFSVMRENTYMLLKVQLPARQRPPACNGTSIGWQCLYWSPDLQKCPVLVAVKACLESKLSAWKRDRQRVMNIQIMFIKSNDIK